MKSVRNAAPASVRETRVMRLSRGSGHRLNVSQPFQLSHQGGHRGLVPVDDPGEPLHGQPAMLKQGQHDVSVGRRQPPEPLCLELGDQKPVGFSVDSGDPGDGQVDFHGVF